MSKEEELIKLLEKIEVPQIPLSDAIKTQISTVLAKIRGESSLLKGSQPSPVLFTPEEKKRYDSAIKEEIDSLYQVTPDKSKPKDNTALELIETLKTLQSIDRLARDAHQENTKIALKDYAAEAMQGITDLRAKKGEITTPAFNDAMVKLGEALKLESLKPQFAVKTKEDGSLELEDMKDYPNTFRFERPYDSALMSADLSLDALLDDIDEFVEQSAKDFFKESETSKPEPPKATSTEPRSSMSSPSDKGTAGKSSDGTVAKSGPEVSISEARSSEPKVEIEAGAPEPKVEIEAGAPQPTKLNLKGGRSKNIGAGIFQNATITDQWAADLLKFLANLIALLILEGRNNQLSQNIDRKVKEIHAKMLEGAQKKIQEIAKEKGWSDAEVKRQTNLLYEHLKKELKKKLASNPHMVEVLVNQKGSSYVRELEFDKTIDICLNNKTQKKTDAIKASSDTPEMKEQKIQAVVKLQVDRNIRGLVKEVKLADQPGKSLSAGSSLDAQRPIDGPANNTIRKKPL